MLTKQVLFWWRLSYVGLRKTRKVLAINWRNWQECILGWALEMVRIWWRLTLTFDPDSCFRIFGIQALWLDLATSFLVRYLGHVRVSRCLGQGQVYSGKIAAARRFVLHSDIVLFASSFFNVSKLLDSSDNCRLNHRVSYYLAVWSLVVVLSLFFLRL